MPLNFPNQWGVKQSWGSEQPPRQRTTNQHVRYVNGNKEIKCPECHNWVRYFRYASESTEYGRVYPNMDMECTDTEGGSIFEITCPECDAELFNGSYGGMEEYIGSDE